MKSSILLILFPLLLGISSCYTDPVIGPRGNQGPQGPVGPEGAPGESGYVFEWSDVSFTSPNYEIVLSYPENFEGLDSDVALVYFLWDVYDTDQGETVEVWRMLDQTVLFQQGVLQYKSDFTKYDVSLFLDATFSLDELTAIDTDAWIVRVVVVPGSFWNSGRVDYSNYAAVAKSLGLPEQPRLYAPQTRKLE